MVVIIRRKGEGIFIGHGIRVTILDLEGDSVKVGVECPVEVAVSRGSSYQRHLREQKVRERMYAEEQRDEKTSHERRA